MEQIEHLRCKHRIRVLQGHEDTTKQNVVSRGLSEWQSGTNLGSVPVGLVRMSTFRVSG